MPNIPFISNVNPLKTLQDADVKVTQGSLQPQNSVFDFSKFDFTDLLNEAEVKLKQQKDFAVMQQNQQSIIPQSQTPTEAQQPVATSKKSASAHKKEVLTPEFKERVKQISKRIGCSYKDLLALMNSESGLNSKAVNKKSGATGLIQFLPSTARALGTSVEDIAKMSPIEQLDYVEKYLLKAKKNAGLGNKSNLNSGELYALVFMPAKAKQDVICDSSSKAYNANKGLDLNHDGKITMNELGTRLSKKQVSDSIFDNRQA